MQRLAIAERPDWRDLAEQTGFRYHTTAKSPYWTDDAYYLLEAGCIERLVEAASTELWDLCLQVVDRASRDDEILRSLGIPETCWGALSESWRRSDPDLLARFDLAFDGLHPAKLHECNADTAGTLFEAAVFQWIWLEDRQRDGDLPASYDQFNHLHEALVGSFHRLGDTMARPLHMAASLRNVEDQIWARYLQDCATQAGHDARYVDLEAIRLNGSGFLVDADGLPIRSLVKAYRWNVLLREPYGRNFLAAGSPGVIEPLWKLVLASKGILVWLWRLFPGHPNLLPAWFSGDPAAPTGNCVVKPLFSIKGHNVTLRDQTLPAGGLSTPGPYGREGWVVQALHRLPTFRSATQTRHASVMSWIVGGAVEGIGILESDGPIIFDEYSRFVPHVVAT
ncbi:MAG: glutathionylspermidine synthase family protein [Reyranella sp.]|uniref:glutathionylspermidine synthase family protein n=1 Tax=Reyranella sp. TaxID=1929291 RepID=UPI00121064AE|nr:glutathionylspermidine synthase family protein [Reyranella sp.]TAJ97414.1 MAG: glutathionylspermidine synthase family protein [Reyranella sp.]